MPPDKPALWRRYKEQKDLAAREELIVAYASIVRYVAGRLAMSLPPNVELDDLESYGLFGLIEAVERFDPGRGFKFETYAVQRVRGAILDGLRADTWAPALRQKARQMEDAYGALESRLGRPPTDEETAAHLGISVADLQRREAEVGAAVLISLEDSWSGEDGEVSSLVERLPDANAPDPVAEAMLSERRDALAQAIEKLPEKERLVVTLFYHEGLTAKEIAMIMKLSVARISQLHSKAILRLRGRLVRFKQQMIL